MRRRLGDRLAPGEFPDQLRLPREFHVQGYFEELIDDAQDAILSMLGQRTLLEVLTELEVRENAKRQVRNPNRR